MAEVVILFVEVNVCMICIHNTVSRQRWGVQGVILAWLLIQGIKELVELTKHVMIKTWHYTIFWVQL